jgi:hypothetical protein
MTRRAVEKLALVSLVLVLLFLDPSRYLPLAIGLCGVVVLLVYVPPWFLRPKT